jgi:hypothetical protein
VPPAHNRPQPGTYTTDGGDMETSDMMFLDCPAYMDTHGALRCGLPAVIHDRYLASSTDGPLESARIRCPRGHWFNGPIEFLTWDKHPPQPPQTQPTTRHQAHTAPGGQQAGRRTDQ